jgi:hypothetical protein
MAAWSMVVENSAALTLSGGRSPDTSTFSLTEPTLSLGCSAARPPTETVTSFAWKLWKPSAVMVTWYWPGSSSGMRNSPAPLALVVRSAAVPRFFTVMETPGTRAPFESVTVPPMAPVVAPCARAGVPFRTAAPLPSVRQARSIAGATGRPCRRRALRERLDRGCERRKGTCIQ